MNPRPPTSHDLAREAGVSQSAVSRAFTPGASISPALRARILVTAEALGYRPNHLPGMMLKGKTGLVAVVAGGFYNPFHMMTLDSFSRALGAAGKRMLLVRVDSDRSLEEAVGDLVGLRVDGVLSALSITSPDVAAALDRHRIPIVTLNSPIESDWIRVVSSDNPGAGAEAARILHAAGARRFAYVAGPADAIAHRQRVEGFVAALAALGIGEVAGAHGGYSYEWGRDMGARLLDAGARPDGIFCANDLIAAGLIDLWRERAGLIAPRDYRIIGYDNIPAAAWSSYALTSFDQDTDRMATIAVKMLTDMERSESIVRLIMPQLIRRISC